MSFELANADAPEIVGAEASSWNRARCSACARNSSDSAFVRGVSMELLCLPTLQAWRGALVLSRDGPQGTSKHYRGRVLLCRRGRAR